MAVGGRRWPSVAVGGRRWPSVAVGGRRWPSVAVGGRRWPSVTNIVWCESGFRVLTSSLPVNCLILKILSGTEHHAGTSGRW